jgi:hypothetical protein
MESLKKSGIEFREIWPETMIHGDYSNLIELVDWLGLKWNCEVLSFMDSKLFKSRLKCKNYGSKNNSNGSKKDN